MDRHALDKSIIEETLRHFKEQNGEKYRIATLGYFGSFARGNADENSDLDVVFDTPEPNLFRAAAMREELQELFGREVDVLQIGGLNDSRLRRRIEKEAVYV